MNMHFYRKLPIPKIVKEMHPMSSFASKIREKTVKELKEILSNKSDKFILIIGPCSADNEETVIKYLSLLRNVKEKTSEKLLIIPRLYTTKPRTTGDGYKGMFHQPDPNASPDLLKGIVSTRNLHMRAINETGFSCADEMVYPDNHRYISDVVSYITVGARSVENQQHRLTASGLDVPVGLKNPTSGDLSIMINAINAAQHSHIFTYRGWEVESEGNPYAHAILRGYKNKHGNSIPNYHFEDIMFLYEIYQNSELKNPAVIIDTNHSNSGKNYIEQPRIAKEVIQNRNNNKDIKKFVKGLMIESYLLDGSQKICKNDIPGLSITDPCLGWEKTEKLIYEIADIL